MCLIRTDGAIQARRVMAMADATHRNRFQGPGPDARYEAFLEQGEFRIQKCTGCGHYMFFPRVICTACGAAEPEWVTASGRGAVYSRTTIHDRPEAGGVRNLAVIELEEGPRLFSRVEGMAPDDVRIGMAVQARIAEKDGARFVVFDPA
jgi:uncharacterized protein